MTPFDPRRWEDEQRDYLDKREEVDAAAWLGAGIGIAVAIAIVHEILVRFFA